jgi:hypothetical protein
MILLFQQSIISNDCFRQRLRVQSKEPTRAAKSTSVVWTSLLVTTLNFSLVSLNGKHAITMTEKYFFRPEHRKENSVQITETVKGS